MNILGTLLRRMGVAPHAPDGLFLFTDAYAGRSEIFKHILVDAVNAQIDKLLEG